MFFLIFKKITYQHITALGDINSSHISNIIIFKIVFFSESIIINCRRHIHATSNNVPLHIFIFIKVSHKLFFAFCQKSNEFWHIKYILKHTWSCPHFIMRRRYKDCLIPYNWDCANCCIIDICKNNKCIIFILIIFHISNHSWAIWSPFIYPLQVHSQSSFMSTINCRQLIII